MEGFTVKVEEDYEDKPIPFPDVQCQPPVEQSSSLDHEFFEIKVELEDESIKKEEEGPVVKEEEPVLKEEEPLVKEEDPQDDDALPKIVAVSGNDKNFEKLSDENADSYDCTFCAEKFARKPRLSKHILAAHLDELLVKCPQCDMKFGDKRALANHQKYHRGEKYFCCGRCGEAFKYRGNYVSHMSDHMGAHQYECGECGRGFSSWRRLGLHMDTRHSPFWPYKCKTCLKPFMEKKKFLRHQKTPCVKREIVPEASDA